MAVDISPKDCLHTTVGTVIDDMEDGRVGQHWRCQICDQTFIPFPNPIISAALLEAVKIAIKVTISYLGNSAVLDPKLIPLDARPAIIKIALGQLKKK